MKLGILVDSVSRLAGGLFYSVRCSSVALVKAGVDVQVISSPDKWTEADLPQWQLLQPVVCDGLNPVVWLQAGKMVAKLQRFDPDINHAHGLWRASSVAAENYRRAKGVPYIVSPRGMLDPWALANSGWKKKIASALFERRNLEGAACLHALCESEARSMRAYGLTNPIVVVPNGVALPAAEPRCFGASVGQYFGVQTEEGAKTRTLLFLGRLHPKKGLPEAVRAWAEVAKGTDVGWRLVIAGWDQGGHEAELKQLCGELGLRWADVPAAALTENSKLNTENSSVVFAGPAFGETKEALMRSADAFILPSLSEGLPMSVLEAWAYGLPVLMTEECNLPEGFAAGAAIGIGGTGRRDDTTTGQPSLRDRSPRRPTDKDQRTKGPEVRDQISEPKGQTVGIATGMRRIMEMTVEERVAMGARGRALVEERFTWPKVAAQMKAVYEWVLGKGPRPDVIQD